MSSFPLRKCMGCPRVKHVPDGYLSISGYSCESCTPNYFICSSCCKCIKQEPSDRYEPFKIIKIVGQYICKNCN